MLDEAFPCLTIPKVTTVTISLIVFVQLLKAVDQCTLIWNMNDLAMVICVNFKFAMTCKASERVLSNFKTTLSWLGARSYVVMLSEFWRIVWFAGNRGSVELWFVVGVATLCSDAGKVNEELRLGVSGSTSLDDVVSGPAGSLARWMNSGLAEEQLEVSSPNSG